MIFLKLQITSITSRKTLYELASSINSMKIIADYSYILSFNLDYPDNMNPLKPDYQDAINQLESSMNYFSKFDRNWDYCSDTEKLFKPYIPVYYSEGLLPNIRHYTAFSFFVQITKSVKFI